jgi:hypothetical protein
MGVGKKPMNPMYFVKHPNQYFSKEVYMLDRMNIRQALASVIEHWSQKVISEANGQIFKVAKGIGETKYLTNALLGGSSLSFF